MSAYLSASSLPRSTSAPVIMGQYDAVQGVSVLPLVWLGLGALGLVGGSSFVAGRATAQQQPQTMTGAIGSEVGAAIKWLIIGGAAYYLLTKKGLLK